MGNEQPVVAVTGGARRVGRSIVTAFAKRGFRVALHYNSSAKAANELVESLSNDGADIHAFQADLTVARACAELRDAVLNHFSRLDVLVNNAASFSPMGICGGQDSAWEDAFTKSLSTNLVAPVRLTRLFADALRLSKGAVVNLCDIGGRSAWPEYALHGVSKAGLEHATKTMAVALGPAVRVNGTAPGIAIFPSDMSEADRLSLVEKTALNRAGTAEDIAEAVLFLATQTYTTGAILPVDGGWSIPTV